MILGVVGGAVIDAELARCLQAESYEMGDITGADPQRIEPRDRRLSVSEPADAQANHRHVERVGVVARKRFAEGFTHPVKRIRADRPVRPDRVLVFEVVETHHVIGCGEDYLAYAMAAGSLIDIEGAFYVRDAHLIPSPRGAGIAREVQDHVGAVGDPLGSLQAGNVGL